MSSALQFPPISSLSLAGDQPEESLPVQRLEQKNQEEGEQRDP